MTSPIPVVDDTPANIQALKGTLKEEGYEVRVATSGKQALDNHFDGSQRTAICLSWLARFHGFARGITPPVYSVANVARSAAPTILP